MHGVIHLHAETAALNHDVAEQFVALATAAQAQHGAFYVALAGGTTPRALYELLASDDYRDRINWSKVVFYFGDERYVPYEHAESNYRMAREALLQQVPVPPSNIHPLDTTLEVRKAAAAYSQSLHQLLPLLDGLPVFDLILLGMGDDGHTASLFPRSCILHDERLCAAVYVEKFKAWRLSLTYKVINNAAQVWILVAGAAKAPVLQGLRAGMGQSYPVAQVQPRGELHWFVDQAAYGESV